MSENWGGASRDDGWRPLSRSPGSSYAEQVRLDIMRRQARELWVFAKERWMLWSVLQGFGGVVTIEGAIEVENAVHNAIQATEAYQEALQENN